MFGRHRRADEEAAREAERRALFEELAKRPDTVCPFLGLAQARTQYHDDVSDDHRCYAFGDPAELSAEQQHKVCLQRGYGNCPRYLRGVLVIPTEELEALRRPQAPLVTPAPVMPRPATTPAARSGGRRGIVALALVLLLAGGGGGAAFLVLNDGGTGFLSSPSPTSSPATSPSASVEETVAPSESAAVTPSPEPTPAPADVFQFYEVSVAPGDYVLFAVDNVTDAVVDRRPATFTNFSQARVDRLERPDGSLHWRTTEGEYLGLSYIADESGAFDSGPFRIRAVYRRPDGGRSSEFLPQDEL